MRRREGGGGLNDGQEMKKGDKREGRANGTRRMGRREEGRRGK